jgi:hypothetical protein
MLILISKDFNNIKWLFPKKLNSSFFNYLVSDQLWTYGSQHVSMPNMMHTCRHSIVGRERENYCIWTYLLFIPHTKLEITCNPKVISNNSLDTRINSKKTLNYSTWCQLRWIIHEPTRSQVLRLDGRTIYSYIILFPFLPVVKVHVVVTRPHIDSCKWLGPKWPRRNFNAY